MSNLIKPVSETTTGIVIGALMFLVIAAGIGLFYQAQVIAKQQAVIHDFLEGRR